MPPPKKPWEEDYGSQPSEKKPWEENYSSADTSSTTPEPKTLSGFGKNVISSGASLVGGLVKAVSSPVETAKSIARLPMGMAQQHLRESVESNTGKPQPIGSEEPYYNAAKDFYANRFGSIGKTADTLYNDPVGSLADASTVLGGAGAALKAIGAAPRIALTGRLGAAVAPAARMIEGAAAPVSKMERVGQAGEMLSKASDFTNPLVIGKEAAKAVLPSGKLELGARRLYQSALKPPTSWFNKNEMTDMLNAGLEGGYPLGPSGTPLKVRGAIDDIDRSVADAVAEQGRLGATVDPRKVVNATGRSVQRFTNQVNNKDALRSIADASEEFLGTHGGVQFAPDPFTASGKRALNDPTPIPIEKAQALKSGTYKQLRDTAYTGELKSATIEAQKDLARGLKEEIYAKLPPEFAALGKKERALIDLDKAIERFSNRQYNHNIFGLEAPLAAGAVGAATGDMTSSLAAALMVKALESPAIKSRIAIAMQRMAKRSANPVTNPLMRGTLASERLNESEQLPQ